MRINLLFILFLILVFPRPGAGQVNDTLIQKRMRKMDNVDVEQKRAIQEGVKSLIDSCLMWMNLRDQSSVEPYDDSVISKFRNCFWEEMIESDTGLRKMDVEKRIICNFFQPRPCNDSSVFPGHYSVNEYVKLIKQWFPEGVDLTHDNVLVDEVPTKEGKNYWINATAHIRFTGYGEYECNSISKEADRILGFVIKLEDWTTTGTKIPSTFKIRWMDYYVPDSIICYYKNFWANFDLSLLGGVSSAIFELGQESQDAIAGIGNLQALPLGSYGVEAKFNFFVQDTFTEFNKAKLWDIGFGFGGRYMQQSWKWTTGDLTMYNLNMKSSPVNGLQFDQYDLLINGQTIEQSVSYNTVSVPLSIQLKRYFGRNKVNSVLIDAGIYVNLLLDRDYSVDRGWLEYIGQNCRFYDPVNDTLYPPVTIEDLPYYGYDTYDAQKSDQDGVESSLLKDIYYSGFVNINFDLRKNNKSRVHWRIGPYFEYTFTNVVDEPTYQLIDITGETEGEIKDFTHSVSKLYPYTVGLRLGLTYNFLPNKKKCYLAE
jgi:hypothetical protein